LPRPSSSVLVSALVVAVLVGLAAWWLAAAPEPPPPPRPAPVDDLQMLAALTDGATTATAGDVLVAGTAGTFLARASDRTVVALPEDGGEPRTLAHLDAPARAMALAEGTLWLTAREQIVKVPLDRSEPSVLACGIGGPRAIAADARWVFVVDVEPKLTGLTHASTIVRVDVTTRDTKVLGRSGGEVTNVALDGTSVYWADRLDGSIVAAPKDGGEPRTLTTDRGLPGSIAVTGDDLVWVEKRSESLWTMPRTGGVPRRLLQDFAGFANVMVDARSVYWSNEAAVDGSFRVLSVPLSGGDEATPLTPAVPSVEGLATDGTRLLWEHGGRVDSVKRL
jgi:hypothetical protein